MSFGRFQSSAKAVSLPSVLVRLVGVNYVSAIRARLHWRNRAGVILALFAPFAPRAAGLTGIASRRMELPALSFWKGEVFRAFPKNSSKRFKRKSPGPFPMRAMTLSPCDVAHRPVHRKYFLTMHECGEKENPWLTPTQYSMNRR